MKFTSVYRQNIKHSIGNRIIINQGGTSSSKTYSILQWLYIVATQKENRLISIVSESVPHLKRGVIRDFLNILKENGIYDDTKWNRTDKIYKVGSSSIEFFSADDDSKLRGARRDILFINECNNIGYEAFNQLEVRTKLKIFLDYNPVSSFWVHQHLLNRDDVHLIKSTYRDNEWLDPQIVKSIEQRKNDPNWWRVYGLGEVGMLEGLIFTNFKPCDKFPEEVKWMVYGQDFGFTNDPSVLVKVGYINGEIWIDEMMYETGLTNQDIADKYEELEVKKNDEIYADSAEPKSIEEIRREGYNIHPSKKGKDSIMVGIDVLKRYKINITKRSLNLLKEFRNYQWKQDKDGNFINKPIDTYNHGIDSIRYVAIKKLSVPSKSWMDKI